MTDFSQKKTLPCGDVFLLGCPDGLEPSTFSARPQDACKARTTSKLSNCLEPLYLSSFQRFCILLLRQFCDEFSQSCI